MTNLNKVLDILFDEVNNKLLDKEIVYVAVGDTDDSLKLLDLVKSKFTNIKQVINFRDSYIMVRFNSNTTCVITLNNKFVGFNDVDDRPSVLITDNTSLRLLPGKCRTYFLADQTGQ